jgi:hypothetical protein
MIAYIALGIGVVALFLAWSANKKQADLKERLAQANSRVYHLRREIEEKQQEAKEERMTLKYELMKLSGNLKITSDMTIGQVVSTHPHAQQVLAGFHIGGCSSCSVDDSQRLSDAVAVNGRELEPILAALNTLATEDANGNGNKIGATEQLKASNIQLHL